MKQASVLRFVVASILMGIALSVSAQSTAKAPEKIIFDTDIGDDIDDVFALGLALRSPEFQILGITTAWGDTNLRARLVQRLLCESGDTGIPLSAGPQTKTSSMAAFSQARWAEKMPAPSAGWPDAITFLREQIHKYPGEITLISVAPLTNVGALIDADPQAFHQLKRVVIMGGSVRKGYGDLGYGPDHGPNAEYNIAMDIPAAKKLFTSGVPIEVMPLDSTQVKFDELLRTALFRADTPLTTSLAVLYSQWSATTGSPTPTLFDAVAVAEALDPSLCPTQPMHLEVDDKGFTREVEKSPNARVCLQSEETKILHLIMTRLVQKPLRTETKPASCTISRY